jgi:hypothetical protein
MKNPIKAPTKPASLPGAATRRAKPPGRIIVAVMALAVTMLAACWALAQGIPQPVLTITPAASNTVVVTITNGVSVASYDLAWTPFLDNPDYPWTDAAIGTNGQTNFALPVEWPSAFFRAEVDTNGVPLWEAADPNNPSAGILTVFIDSPANGAVLQ